MTSEQLVSELLLNPMFQLDESGCCRAENPSFLNICKLFLGHRPLQPPGQALRRETQLGSFYSANPAAASGSGLKSAARGADKQTQHLANL